MKLFVFSSQVQYIGNSVRKQKGRNDEKLHFSMRLQTALPAPAKDKQALFYSPIESVCSRVGDG